jgi:hypothetical protein
MIIPMTLIKKNAIRQMKADGNVILLLTLFRGLRNANCLKGDSLSNRQHHDVRKPGNQLIDVGFPPDALGHGQCNAADY